MFLGSHLRYGRCFHFPVQTILTFQGHYIPYLGAQIIQQNEL